MSDCVFCRIAAHEIPSTVVYEDDDLIAFHCGRRPSPSCAGSPTPATGWS